MLVHHHIKYKEIHGVDEVVLMEKGEHFKLHARLRKEGKCNIPATVLHQISDKANKRRGYNADPAVRERQRARDARRRMVFPRLRPDIINAALVRPCTALL